MLKESFSKLDNGNFNPEVDLRYTQRLGKHSYEYSGHMSDGKFAAMVSTQSKPWNSIPRAPLMTRLNEKTERQVVRSDWLYVNDAPEPIVSTA